MRNLALEIAPVRVNLIAAGFVDTPLSASLLGKELEARREQLRKTLPIGRVVGPADVAALAVHIMIYTALTGGTYDITAGTTRPAMSPARRNSMQIFANRGCFASVRRRFAAHLRHRQRFTTSSW